MAGPAASDVPDRYDVVFVLNDGTTYGYLYADSVESNLPFRTHKALYSYSPTFLERQNLSQQYGDNFQDFFLTGAQADFSLGEKQKFFRVNDQDRSRRYWAGSNVDPTTVPGNVTLTNSLQTVTSFPAGTGWVGSNFILSGQTWYGVDSTNLYGISANGTVTTIGAHGLGLVSPFNLGITTDQSNVYICGERTGTSTGSIRKWNGSTFSTFSTTRCTSMVFLNNILYGYQLGTDSLLSFDTAGNPTTQFQWKNADGASATQTQTPRMVAYGGSIYIMRINSNTELWRYDGSGVNKLADFPIDFVGQRICVNNGIVFVAGYMTYVQASTYRPQIYYYANGSIGKLWESAAPAANANQGAVVPFGNGAAFQDPTNNNILLYDLAAGGVHTVAAPGAAETLVGSNTTSAILLVGGAGGLIYPNSSLSYNSSGYIQTSQYDFDNTLTKVFRGIKVDADIPANTSIDIAYQLDGCGGTYTTLQTSAVSGTEYLLPNNTTGHSISVQVTLKSATGAATPTLKRVYVRAAPTLQQFRKREYLFDITSGTRDEIGKSSRRTRDGFVYPKDAITACNDLIKIATQTVPFTVYDRFVPGGMTVLADLQQNQAGYDGFAIYEVEPNVYIGRINLREV